MRARNSGLTPPEDRATIAAILRPRGIRGEVTAYVLTDHPERFDDLDDVWLEFPDGTVRPARVEDAWFHKGSVILKFVGVDSMTEAEGLAKCKVQIPLDERVALDDDEFYIDTLIGCRAELADGTCLGEVVDVVSSGGGEILVVLATDAHPGILADECLIPFVGEICPEVDVVGKRIVIAPPEGLFET